MALTDKNLIITPNIGSTNDPKIDFIGASAAVGPSTITATIYSTNNGTLSFDGTEGSLFSISNNLSTGSIFSVNPISGIPIIDVNADRTIALNPYGGNTGIGLTNPSQKLHVQGNLRVTGAIYDSNNSAGTNNQVLKSTGVGVTWVSGSGSGVDADLLDGNNSTYYLNYNNLTNQPTIGNATLTLNVSGTGLSGSQTFTANQTTAATFTVTSNATSANTVSTIVARDASGNFSAGTITATTFSGNLANTLTLNTSGTGLSGSTTFNNSGAATFTVTSNATSANTVSTIVARDASGNFSAGAITATNYLVTETSSTRASGASIQRVFSKSVSATELYKLAEFEDTEGTVAIEIQVSSISSGNSGTSIYRFQSGFSSLTGSYYRLYPFMDGRGHGDGPDSGLDSNAWNLFIYGTTVTGSNYRYGVAVHVPSGRTGKTLVVSITELKRGMTFTNQSSSAVITTFTNSGNIYSHNNLLVGNRIGVGKVPSTPIDVNGTVTATTFSGSLANTLTLNTSGTGLSGSTTFNNSGAATFTVTSNATSANTVSTIVARDASGNFTAGTITATSFSGSLANTLTLNTSGTGLSGSTTFNNSGAATFTVTSNATSANTVSTIVARDGSGNFSAGTITAALTGNSSTATNLSTNRTNWSTNGTISAVVGQLAWKNYANNHTIFDASNGTSPDGGAVNNTNSGVAWFATYPTLMGWNGTSTYGVRVDSARVSDNAGGITGYSGTYWTSNNDGAGSGLDADLLDGQQGSYYQDASNLNAGTVPVLRLGSSGTRDNTTFLRGDNTWQTLTGVTITDDTTTNATRYIVFEDVTSGSSSAMNVSSSKLTYNPSSGTLSVDGAVEIGATDSGTQKFSINFNETTDSLDFDYTA